MTIRDKKDEDPVYEYNAAIEPGAARQSDPLRGRAEKKRTYEFSGRIPLRTLESGRHSYLTALDPNISSLVGEAIIMWGAFEVYLDAFIECLIVSTRSKIKKKWRRGPFSSRILLFDKMGRSYTDFHFKYMKVDLQNIVVEAKRCHELRNLVAHGRYAFEDREHHDDQTTARIMVYSSREDVNTSIELTEENAEQLWHDISHLTGHLLTVVNRMGAYLNHPAIVIEDKDIADGADSGNFRMVKTTRFGN